MSRKVIANWIHQSEIDREKWDNLVDNSLNPCLYNYSYYFDAVAIDWEAYIAEDYSYAIPVGIVKKGGLKRVYPALFQGYVEPIGEIDSIDWVEFEKSLLSRFSKGELNIRNANLKGGVSEDYVYQRLKAEEFKLKTQAKRMLKRFENTSYTISEEVSTKELAEFVVKELAKILPIYTSKDVRFFYDIIDAIEKSGSLYKLGLYEGDKFMGGLIGFESKTEMFYFKGAVDESAMKEGGMYALMNQFIEKTFDKKLEVNFGGSRVEGVRFFYQRFNGVDEYYQNYKWDNSPFWFKLGYNLYKKIRK